MTVTAPTAADRATWRRLLADVSVVTVTPFTQDGHPDADGIAGNVRHIVDSGVRLLVAGGNTGEAWSLSDDELVDVVAAHAEATAGGDAATVIAGVTARPEALPSLAYRLRDAGARALMVHQPPNPYAGDVGLAAYYRALAAATDLPLIAYVRSPAFGPLAASAVEDHPAWVGVKYAVPDPRRFAELAAAAPTVAWVCGLAESWAPAFHAVGAIGFTSGVANIEPGRSLALHRALVAGDRTAALVQWRALQPFEALRARRGDANNVAVIKAALDLIGLRGGPVRPPLEDLPPDERRELEQILQDWRRTG